jgi:hypothetical protein
MARLAAKAEAIGGGANFLKRERTENGSVIATSASKRLVHSQETGQSGRILAKF